MLNTLESLFNLARERKKTPVDGSYTNRLLSDKSLSKEKVLEEINELIQAVKLLNSEDKVFDAKPEFFKSDIKEASDVIYHLLVYLEANNIKYEDVLDELNNRTSQSGLEEKANRN